MTNPIGSFSAASNASGILEDTIAITEFDSNNYNALSFWECACAAPNIQINMNRPGTVHLNVNFTMSYKEIDFLVQALEFVSSHSWKFLPLYTFVVASDEWKHRSKLTKMF
ncbi:hypothetical protein DICPUDRAFT_151408 [Dictyostelium purpureum]|uniref:Uncharacterized protein n=1 Tax=Dictyostelium purpureum TaxID=5786 RepID=F0ZIR7_DICPU|nr:uncharacterized protein DICPUDRAFT_151408 [Dictyostelium purpureum]EGC36171.1 hypothetical protein DICPUDRAFT_151408 [Dictyostelium purpureum]|eukprot:XP_003287304.1 hypothetical protein DICPUDRAFT_151408 [Dictyostelium purpureum]